MKKTSLVRTAVAGAVLMGAAAGANAMSVTFGPATDSDGLAAFYDPAANVAGPLTLTLGLSNFTASAALGAGNFAKDAQDFSIWCDGCVITKVTLFEEGSGNGSTAGFAGAQAKLTAGGKSQNTAQQIFVPNSSGSFSIGTTIDLTSLNLSEIAVNVDNSLFAVNGATISKTLSKISVEVAPVPLPPAAWMLGSALVGLATVGRRKLG